MSVQSSVGLLTAGGLVAYDVRTITQNNSADNKEYVSSKTDGKTFNEPGNLNKSWDISLYAPAACKEVPAALKAGQLISCEIPAGATSQQMLISTANLEVNIESGDLIGISLTCVPYQAASYA